MVLCGWIQAAAPAARRTRRAAPAARPRRLRRPVRQFGLQNRGSARILPVSGGLALGRASVGEGGGTDRSSCPLALHARLEGGAGVPDLPCFPFLSRGVGFAFDKQGRAETSSNVAIRTKGRTIRDAMCACSAHLSHPLFPSFVQALSTLRLAATQFLSAPVCSPDTVARNLNDDRTYQDRLCNNAV